MTRLKQYMIKPTPTRQINASCSSQSASPSVPSVSPRLPTGLGGRPTLLYQETEEEEAQGMVDVKKLSKQRESAAAQMQTATTSIKVIANLADVRQRPTGRPKYSSCI